MSGRRIRGRPKSSKGSVLLWVDQEEPSLLGLALRLVLQGHRKRPSPERESNMNEGRERVEVMDNHRVYKGEGWEGRGQVREGLANLVRRGWKKRDEEGPTKI